MPPDRPNAASKHDLAKIMAGVAELRPQAIADFYEVAASPVRSLKIRAFEQRNVRVSSEVSDDVVRDLLLALVELAPGWRPDGGAAPWYWAKTRLVALAFARIGKFCDDIDTMLEAPADGRGGLAGAHSADGWETLEDLAGAHPQLDLLARCLLDVCSERDRKVWLDFVVERANGNRSPAVTVAALHDMNPAQVRKVVQRVKDKLLYHAATEDAFANLLDVPALAA